MRSMHIYVPRTEPNAVQLATARVKRLSSAILSIIKKRNVIMRAARRTARLDYGENQRSLSWNSGIPRTRFRLYRTCSAITKDVQPPSSGMGA